MGYPIWLWHWADPATLDSLVHPAAWRALSLTSSVIERKEVAVSRHVSQVTPLSDSPGDDAIVHEAMAAHFARPFELFIHAGVSA